MRPRVRTTKVAAVVWGLFTLLALGLGLATLTTDIPYPQGDVYMFQDVLTGRQPLTWAWLWEPTYGHRTTLVRLLMYVWACLTKMNLRLAADIMAVVYILLGGVALKTLGRTRGCYLYTDVLIPAVMLSTLHLANILAVLQLAFVIPYAMLIVLFCLLWRSTARLSRAAVATAVATAILAPHCSAFGWFVGFCSFLWLVWYLGSDCMMETRWTKWVMMGMLVVVGLTYFAVCVPWEAVKLHVNVVSSNMHQERYGTPLTPLKRLANGLTFLALWSGVSVAKTVGPWIGCCELVLLGILTVAAAKAYRRDRLQRYRLSAFILVAGVSLATAASIVAVKDSGWHPRYYALIAPLVIACYAALDLVEEERTRRTLRVAMVLVVLPLTVYAYNEGLSFRNERQQLYRDFRAWVRTGMDKSLLTSPQYPTLARYVYPDLDTYADKAYKVHDAGMAMFRKLRVVFRFRTMDDLRGWTVAPEGVRIERLSPSGESVLHLSCGTEPVLSAPFIVDHDYLQFRLGRSQSETRAVPMNLKIDLIDGTSRVLLSETFAVQAPMVEENVNVAQYEGQIVRLRFTDEQNAPPNGILISAMLLSDCAD